MDNNGYADQYLLPFIKVQDVVCRTSGGTEKCYYIIDKVVNEVEAKTYCSSLDSTARLLSIHSAEEATFVTGLLKGHGKFPADIWLGLEHGAGGYYRWVDGQSSDYTNWMPGWATAFDDDDGQGRPWGDCSRLAVSEDKSYGFWYTDRCEKGLAVVCQVTSSVLVNV
ncbi:unnamed protein product [Medioppia subpectinata]|uniref:C-type lectin domain-containing protein n=1 Tax=Medioppia subpectinata TaxID=1979941 RepID=A0A7R9KLJ0_9ACAR|nr:unnamed protein product [Medioppia subpectinata]CAG2105809.1 unnamed protein product [Medioppia subpectinata]